MALLSLGFFISELPGRATPLTPLWFTTDQAPRHVIQGGLDRLGLTPGLYAAYGLGLYCLRAAAFYLAGALLFWRRSRDRMALLVAYLLVALPVGDMDPPVLHAMAASQPVRAAVGIVVELVAFVLLLWVFLLFPDGQFRPRWTLAVAMAWVLVGTGTLAWPGSMLDLFSWPEALAAGFVPAVGALAFCAQVWRYRSISDPVARQQTKWFAVGWTIVLAEFAVGNMLADIRSFSWPALSPTQVVLADFVLNTVHTVAFLAIPLALAVAVLRYRLWDIDAFINRALVYGSLTAALAGVYVGTVLAVGGLARAATGQNSGLTIAVATLATAGLVRPLRARLQTTIERRFYRRKYDAARTLAVFGATLRDETDLERIHADLLAVVAETMQPAHVSLWLRTDATR